jgi:nucleosome binding factor SPN SPT16 subunit
LKGGKVPLEVLVRGKDAEANEKLFVKINDSIKAAGKKVGILPKDTSSGPFIDEWKKVYGNISKDVEEVDITPALSAAALAVKDENELVRILPFTPGHSYSDFVPLAIANMRHSALCEQRRKHALRS